MKATKNTVVALEYTLHLGDGEVIDRSEPSAPLVYLHGNEQIVPGLERALEGLSAGDSKEVVVAPGDGYGELDPDALKEVPKDAFPKKVRLEAGMRFMAQDSDGDPMPVYIREVRSKTVMVDTNHPLAGKTLHFAVTVREVRAATEEELHHGHVHGPGGAH